MLLRALGDARTRRSRAALIALLGNGEESDLQVLEQLVKGGRGHRPSLTLRGRLDSCLTSTNVRIRSLAALAVAELHEPDLAPRLIDLLLDENALVRRNATVALQRMTGATYEEDVDAWRALLDRESTWFNESWPQIQDCLDSGDLGRTVQALREIAPHRLHRDPLCQHLGDLLPEAPPSIGLGIAATLVELGSAWAVDPLFRALETRDDPDDELRKAAHVALERLTGLSLPDDVEDCRERIGL